MVVYNRKRRLSEIGGLILGYRMGAFQPIRQSIGSCRLSKLDVRRVAALRQIDADGIVLAIGFIIFAKPVAQAPGFQPHDRIDIGVKRLGTIEHCQSDVIAFQPLAASGQRFIDDVLQEPLTARRLVERAAVEDAIQLLANSLLVGFAPAIGRDHAPPPRTLKRRRSPAGRGRLRTVAYYDQCGRACHPPASSRWS